MFASTKCRELHKRQWEKVAGRSWLGICDNRVRSDNQTEWKKTSHQWSIQEWTRQVPLERVGETSLLEYLRWKDLVCFLRWRVFPVYPWWAQSYYSIQPSTTPRWPWRGRHPNCFPRHKYHIRQCPGKSIRHWCFGNTDWCTWPATSRSLVLSQHHHGLWDGKQQEVHQCDQHCWRPWRVQTWTSQSTTWIPCLHWMWLYLSLLQVGKSSIAFH